jgi:probable F420-dependent oxidoreductase
VPETPLSVTGYLGQGPLADLADAGRTALEAGLDRVWQADLAHDPYLPLALVARERPGLAIGTSVAIAFARSPWATAQASWDLAGLSGGTFVLGLGTQVRSHVERRIGGTWQTPVPYLRDYVGSVRAIWEHWATGEPLAYTSEHVNLNLTAPIFRSDPHGFSPQVYLGGVNAAVCRLAGRIADGFVVHGFNSRDYVTERVLPDLLADRDRTDLRLVVPALVGGPGDETVRRQVAFYASTPSYRTILDQHGLTGLGERLAVLARDQDWDAMTALVDDDVLDLFAIRGTAEEIGREIVRRHRGLADEVVVMSDLAGSDPAWWRVLRRTVSEEESRASV